MNITPENILDIQHQEWLNHPVTRQLIHNLEKLKANHVKEISFRAMDVDPLNLRATGFSIRQLDVVLNLISNTQLFVSKSKE